MIPKGEKIQKRCKDCVAEGIQGHRPAPHPGPRCATHHRMFEKSQRLNAAMKRVENVYGLKPGEYEALRAAQEGRCAICRRATGKTRRLSVDHDHKLERIDLRGSVRGLLCRPCNDMLGHARDDVQVFIRAARYLLEPPARAVLLALLQTEQTEE